MTYIDPSAVLHGRRAVAAMFFINGFIVGSWATQIPHLIKRLDVSEATFGLIALGFGLGGVIAMPVAGVLMARLGTRAVTLPFAMLAVFGLPIVVSATDVVVSFIMITALGAALGGMDVAMNANAVTVERRLQRAIMSSTHGFWSLGGFVGGGLGGYTIQAYGPMPHAILVAAVTATLLAIASGYLIGGDRAIQAANAAPVGWRAPRSGAIFAIGLIAMLCVLPEITMRNWAALFMEQDRGSEIGAASLAFALFAGAMAAMRFLGDGVRTRFGAVTTLRVSSLVTAAGFVAASVLPWPPLAIAAFAVAGLGAANLIPIAFSAAGGQDDMASSTGMSIALTMTSSSVLISPWITGLVVQSAGFAAVFGGVAATLVVVALLSAPVHRADLRAV